MFIWLWGRMSGCKKGRWWILIVFCTNKFVSSVYQKSGGSYESNHRNLNFLCWFDESPRGVWLGCHLSPHSDGGGNILPAHAALTPRAYPVKQKIQSDAGSLILKRFWAVSPQQIAGFCSLWVSLEPFELPFLSSIRLYFAGLTLCKTSPGDSPTDCYFCPRPPQTFMFRFYLTKQMLPKISGNFMKQWKQNIKSGFTSLLNRPCDWNFPLVFLLLKFSDVFNMKLYANNVIQCFCYRHKL